MSSLTTECVLLLQGNPREIDVMLLLECEAADGYRLTVVNVSEEGGAYFHSIFPSAMPAKNRYATGLVLGVFERTRVMDMSFWMWVLLLRCRCSPKHTADKLYEILGCVHST